MTSASAQRTRHAARAARIALAWGERYTRGLDETVAEDRVAELRSDLWEQRAAGSWHRRRDLSVALSIIGRMVRGVPADLTWRQGELGGIPGGSRATRAWDSRISVVLAAAIGGGALVSACYAVARLLDGAGFASSVASDVKLSLMTGIVALVAGLALLRHRDRRWLASLWIGFGTVVALRSTADTLFEISTTARSFAASSADLVAWIPLIGLGAFFVLLALSWGPEQQKASG